MLFMEDPRVLTSQYATIFNIHTPIKVHMTSHNINLLISLSIPDNNKLRYINTILTETTNSSFIALKVLHQSYFVLIEDKLQFPGCWFGTETETESEKELWKWFLHNVWTLFNSGIRVFTISLQYKNTNIANFILTVPFKI